MRTQIIVNSTWLQWGIATPHKNQKQLINSLIEEKLIPQCITISLIIIIANGSRFDLWLRSTNVIRTKVFMVESTYFSAWFYFQIRK